MDPFIHFFVTRLPYLEELKLVVWLDLDNRVIKLRAAGEPYCAIELIIPESLRDRVDEIAPQFARMVR